MFFCAAVIILSCLCFSLYLLSLHKRLWNVTAVDFQVDFGVIFFLLPLFVQSFPEVEQVERQQESQHTDNQQTNVHLHQTAKMKKRSEHARWVFNPFSNTKALSFVCLTQSGSPFRGPIMAMNKGCCSRANKALTRDCIPVRLPN